MTRLAAGLESLDDEHAAAAARARLRERLGWIGVVCLLSFCRSIGPGWGQVEGLAHRGDGFGAIAAGEQAVVADGMEALWEDGDEETAGDTIDVGGHCGGAGRAFDPVAFVLSGDTPPGGC